MWIWIEIPKKLLKFYAMQFECKEEQINDNEPKSLLTRKILFFHETDRQTERKNAWLTEQQTDRDRRMGSTADESLVKLDCGWLVRWNTAIKSATIV